jgi:hypothetical protein
LLVTWLSWQDAENFISEFALMKEPSAVRLQQAKSLAITASFASAIRCSRCGTDEFRLAAFSAVRATGQL